VRAAHGKALKHGDAGGWGTDGPDPRGTPLIDMYGMGCQYSTRGLVSSEKHETTPETGVEGRGGHTAGVGTITVGMGGYGPLPRSLTAISCPANSARVLRSRTCGRLYLCDALLEWLAQDLEPMPATLRQFLQEEDAVVGQRDLSRRGDLAPHQPCPCRRWSDGRLKLLFTSPRSPRYNWAHALEVCRSHLL
jgi:hypothetical protein